MTVVADELDDLSGEPRYIQVARILEREIRAGQWKQAPSQIRLHQRFGIAKATAGKVHALLADHGYLAAVPGIGMVVTPADRWRTLDDDAT